MTSRKNFLLLALVFLGIIIIGPVLRKTDRFSPQVTVYLDGSENSSEILSNGVLSKLSNKTRSSLFHRYTRTLQIYCAKRSRHGSLSDGWNICVDDCYRPKENTTIHILRNKKDETSIKSTENIYKCKVLTYTMRSPSAPALNSNSSVTVSLKDSVWHSKNNDDVLIIDVGPHTAEIVDYITQKGILLHVQQLSIRFDYGNTLRTPIDYGVALKQMRQLYKYGFRIYWFRMDWSCILKDDKQRTSCIYIDMIYKHCRDKEGKTEHHHLILPDDKTLRKKSENDMKDLYYRYLTSIQIHCKEIVRLGKLTDGGWDSCHDATYRPSKPCLVYSFGINGDFSFDDDISSKYGCDVHSFDPSMKQKDHKHNSNVWFHNLGIRDKRNEYDAKKKWKLSTLKEIRERLNHSSRAIHTIKMDIESSEWKALPEMVHSGAMRDVTQLYVEFHDTDFSVEYLKTLRLIYEEGFRIYWYHRNPACAKWRKLIEEAFCIEVYFLREKVKL